MLCLERRLKSVVQQGMMSDCTEFILVVAKVYCEKLGACWNSEGQYFLPSHRRHKSHEDAKRSRVKK